MRVQLRVSRGGEQVGDGRVGGRGLGHNGRTDICWSLIQAFRKM